MNKVNLKTTLKSVQDFNKCIRDLDENQIECVLYAMKQACEQTVELCAYNAEVEEIEIVLYAKVTETKHIVDKQSILNTKNQII